MADNIKAIRNICKNIGQNIYDIRRKKRMTLKKLARLPCTSIDLLDQYEIGKNQISLDAIMNIASSFDVSFIDLVTRDD